MRIRAWRFNIYFASLAALLLVSCRTTEKKAEREKEKETSAIRLHLEMLADGSPFVTTAQVLRSAPIPIGVQKMPFLDERSVESAAVVDTAGGHAIQLKFDRHGTLMLESMTSMHRGKRVAILALFPESRWLAAPRIAQRVTSGVFSFVPDATREESERIVRGLNNLAIKEKRQAKPPRTPGKSKASEGEGSKQP